MDIEDEIRELGFRLEEFNHSELCEVLESAKTTAALGTDAVHSGNRTASLAAMSVLLKHVRHLICLHVVDSEMQTS